MEVEAEVEYEQHQEVIEILTDDNESGIFPSSENINDEVLTLDFLRRR